MISIRWDLSPAEAALLCTIVEQVDVPAGGVIARRGEVADALGIGRQDAERIVRYLEDRGFVTKTGRTGMVLRITAQGIDHVETTAVEEDA